MYEISNDLYIVAGVSGAGKSSFIATICDNQKNFSDIIGCQRQSHTKEIGVYGCRNRLIFGKKIVKIIDTPGLHDSFGRDEHFL